MSFDSEVAPATKRVASDERSGDMKEWLGFVQEPPVDGLVTLRFWEKTFTVPRSDLLESPYFRRFLGEEGAFATKPLPDGSYFINESGEDFEEILYKLRGETLERSQRLDSKILRFLPSEMLEIQSENAARKEIVDTFISFLQGWIRVNGTNGDAVSYRYEKSSRKNRAKRYFYHFSVVEVTQFLKEGGRIVMEYENKDFAGVHLWIQTEILGILLDVSTFNFDVEIIGPARGAVAHIQCIGALTSQSLILTGLEVDPLDVKVDNAPEEVRQCGTCYMFVEPAAWAEHRHAHREQQRHKDFNPDHPFVPRPPRFGERTLPPAPPPGKWGGGGGPAISM